MRHLFNRGFPFLLAITATFGNAPAEERPVSTEMTALEAYETGFAYDVMRAPGKAGVQLNDMVLIEDDGPGSGVSEKGTYLEEISKGALARKIFQIDDPTALEAHIVLFMTPQNPRQQEPLFIILNGTRIPGNPISWHEEMWHWIKVPVNLLKKGDNTLVVGCDAPKGKGYQLFIARADEFEGGGGAYSTGGISALAAAGKTEIVTDENAGKMRLLSIGKNSAKSMNGGRTWVRMKLGNTNDVIGEYTIRLNLKKFKPEGSLLSPPIDLWDGIAGMDKLKPRCTVSGLRLNGEGEMPEGTSILWQYRTASTPDMMNAEWTGFQTLGSGPTVNASFDAEGKRYMQWRAVIKSPNPLRTPVVKRVRIDRTLTFTPPAPHTFYVWKYENMQQRYPSVPFAYEKWDEPKLRQLRERLKLDELIRGAETDFDRISRVRHLVSTQWHHGSPSPEYPEWNALQILDRRDSRGVGGMCIQFSIVFIQSLLSLGYQARHINMFAHETVEVYVDELGKWVHVDPESVFDSYEYETVDGMPINTFEQHRFFLKENGFSAARPIDWKATDPWAWPAKEVQRNPQPLSFSTFTGWINNPSQPNYPPQHALAGFLRMMPRNDYFSRPYPRPLAQGSSNWPWTGYLNWYDEATPRKLQYAYHTDREIDFYPTLNRVQYSAVLTDREGKISIDMITFAPNFDGFEVNTDGRGWEPSSSSFVWKLKRSAVNTLEMRVRNTLGPKGKPSVIQVMWHYKEPFQKRDW
ncbi:MAG: transglutaminase-like domain-containing protein [Candidatus Latescibacterota bacterium]